MDILHGIEAKALQLRDVPPQGTVTWIDDASAEIELPMERPLHTPSVKPKLADTVLLASDADIDTGALFDQVVIDKEALARNVRQALQAQSQVTLRELTELQPLRHGLAELVAYLQLDGDYFYATVDESTIDTVTWRSADADGHEHLRRATLPRVIFVRPTNG
jgi:hypothetical protein